MARAIQRANLQGGARGNGRSEKRKMNNEHTQQVLEEDIDKAVRTYFTLLKRFALPPRIADATAAIRAEYEATGFIRATQLALLRRCFLRGRHGRYEVDWLPAGYLDMAIAQELDGAPCRMLGSAEAEQAIKWLAIGSDHADDVKAWHQSVQDQLILTGWLPAGELATLKHRYQECRGRRTSPLQGGEARP